MAEKFDLEALKREYVASDERGDAKFAIDFHDMTIVLERLEQAEQAVQRVREVHRPVSDPFGVSCAVCIGDSRRNPYPCDTIRALDGDGRG